MFLYKCIRQTQLGLVLALTLTAAKPVISAPAVKHGARQGVILSNPPKAGSKARKALEYIGGKIIIEPLAMTGAEMWWIEPSRFDGFLHTADEQGIIQHTLNAKANHIMSAMPEKMTLSPKQKSMMTLDMASKSTMGMTMMHIPSPSMAEYALTRNMKRRAGAGTSTRMIAGPADIVIPLSLKTSITIERTDLEVTKKGCVWHGRIKGSGEAVTLMWWSGGRLAGSFNYGGHMYSIKDMGHDMYGIVEKDPAMMPDDHSALPVKGRKTSASYKDALVMQGDASLMRGSSKNKLNARRPSAGSLINLQDAAARPQSKQSAADIARQISNQQSGVLKASVKNDIIKVRVLVGYTPKAARHYTDIHRDLIALAVEQTNQTFKNSGITNVKIELAGSFKVDYDETKGHHFDHLWRFADRGDKYMEKVHRLRNEKRADIALLILDNPSGCGLATRVRADENEAFAVIHHECATSTYSFAHEIGHLFGARHDRSLDKNTTPFPYGHGYVNGKKWRTMMSYRATCKGCPRLPLWSNPTTKVRGEHAGDELSDNARVIYKQAKRVAQFR